MTAFLTLTGPAIARRLRSTLLLDAVGFGTIAFGLGMWVPFVGVIAAGIGVLLMSYVIEAGAPPPAPVNPEAYPSGAAPPVRTDADRLVPL